MAEENKGNESQKQDSKAGDAESLSPSQSAQMSDLKQSQQPASQSVEGSAKQPQQQKPKGSKAIIYIIIAVVIAAGAVLGYGYWNGSQVKAYAEKGDEYIKTVDAWDLDISVESSGDLSEGVEKIKSDSERVLGELNSKKAPGKAKKLESDLKEYFGLAKEFSDDLEGVVAWMEAMIELQEGFYNVTDFDTSSSDGLTSSMESLKKSYEDSAKKLGEVDVPDSLKEQNEALIKALENMADVIDEFIKATESGDADALYSLEDDMQDISSDLMKVFSNDLTNDLFSDDYQDKKDKIEVLEKSIKDEISSLKSLGTFIYKIT